MLKALAERPVLVRCASSVLAAVLVTIALAVSLIDRRLRPPREVAVARSGGRAKVQCGPFAPDHASWIPTFSNDVVLDWCRAAPRRAVAHNGLT